MQRKVSECFCLINSEYNIKNLINYILTSERIYAQVQVCNYIRGEKKTICLLEYFKFSEYPTEYSLHLNINQLSEYAKLLKPTGFAFKRGGNKDPKPGKSVEAQ